MIRAFAIFCCLTGFLVGLLVVTGIPRTGDVEARETLPSSKEGCVTREVALDEGYGISRKVSQLVCADKN